MPVTLKCKQCGKKFKVKFPHMAKGRKYCSKKCADDFKRSKPLVEFFGPKKAKNVTETARKRAKNNPNLKKFKKGYVPWNKDRKGNYFSEEAIENVRKGQLKVAKMRKEKSQIE